VSGLSTGLLPFQQVFATVCGSVFVERLRSCHRPGCDRLFIRRKRQRYCSPQCSQQERFPLFLDRHPNYRRDQYKKALRARTGPNVVFGRCASRAQFVEPRFGQRGESALGVFLEIGLVHRWVTYADDVRRVLTGTHAGASGGRLGA
jgi:CGNR zinc finger